MNIIPYDVQFIIYRYVHLYNLNLAHSEMSPLNPKSSPFRMQILYFNDRSSIECFGFESDLCKMCYTRNGCGERNYQTWTKCYWILDLMNEYSIICNKIYHNNIYHNNTISQKGEIDVTDFEGCNFAKLFQYLERESIND
jgi:hypothetical protein